MQSQTEKPRRMRERVGLVAITAVLTTAATVGITGIATADDEGTADGPGKEPTEKEITALFDEWNSALQTGDAQAVADRYAPDAVLLPTASAQIRTDRDGIVDYFEHFQENDPVGEKTETVVTVLDENTAIDAGTYVFTLTDPETGEVREVTARYTYAYEKIDGDWLIVNHHSSATPAEG
ncbi:SgcJ/EcaC family oxidoreductase [Promicromonospora panici]|uniref:SgcJ/EcaC family oxidoreductase n=1 Tax=Promicromonospora panici TaxID=2219658 RepID=UPI00101CAFA0|nr:SgcJ/EcaC family oxidoreductase [Promicromonospora panici]